MVLEVVEVAEVVRWWKVVREFLDIRRLESGIGNPGATLLTRRDASRHGWK